MNRGLEGKAIGLLIAKKLIEMMEGCIGVDSEKVPALNFGSSCF
ncbi:hypothetical protein imdm_2011 [gamma proteobacterium IMCC2047]|nr:hypothetical protein imdm_2011 [gamma proteobacterium IMCC2047]